MSRRNRLALVHNPYQGEYKKVLCVCSAGILRSPTAALVLAQEFGYNTRAAGLETEFALIPVDDVLVAWADEIVCMEKWQAEELKLRFEPTVSVYALGIEDSYNYRDPLLIELIKKNYLDIEIMRRAYEQQPNVSGTDERGSTEETNSPATEGTGTV